MYFFYRTLSRSFLQDQSFVLFFFEKCKTLPRTNTSPLKIGLLKRERLVFQPSIFRGHVSFREGTLRFVFPSRPFSTSTIVRKRSGHSIGVSRESPWLNFKKWGRMGWRQKGDSNIDVENNATEDSWNPALSNIDFQMLRSCQGFRGCIGKRWSRGMNDKGFRGNDKLGG